MERFYDASSQRWLLNDGVLEALDNDVQAVIECTNENDTILFVTDKTIKPARTLILSQNLTIASQSESSFARSGSQISAMESVRLTCPDSGRLLISRYCLHVL